MKKKFWNIMKLMFALPILIIMGGVLNSTAIAGSLRRVWNNAGAPTSGTSGTFAGSAEPGDLLVDTTNGVVYTNKNTQASPNWTPLPAPQVTQKAASDQVVDAGEAGVLEATADGIYLYLPTYVGFKGLTFMVKCLAAFSAGVKVYPLLNSSEQIDGATIKTSTAQYDCLTVVAGTQGWNIVAAKGTWS